LKVGKQRWRSSRPNGTHVEEETEVATNTKEFAVEAHE